MLPLLNEMERGVARLLRVRDAPELAAVFQFAGVADLAAHFGVERRGVEDNGGLVLYGDDFEDFGGRLQFVVADELGGRGGLDLGEFDDLLLLRGAGASAFLLAPSACCSRSTSTVIPRSRAISSVRSSGKP